MDPASFTFAVVGVADVCIKYGKIFISKCQAYRHADKEIRELLLRVEHHWLMIEAQMVFLNQIWHTLDGRFQIHQNMVLQVLEGKLQASTSLLDAIIGDSKEEESSVIQILEKKGRLKKGRFALSVKDCLETTISDLETWHRMIDPSWFLILRVPSQHIDNVLRSEPAPAHGPIAVMKSLRESIMRGLYGDDFDRILMRDSLSERIPLRYSSAKVSQTEDSGREVIVDTMVCSPEADETLTTQDVKALAWTLTKVDPSTFGLLRCLGVIKTVDSTSDPPSLNFEFVFQIQEGLRDPQSFRNLLLGSANPPRLNEKFQLARQLANSILFIHNTNFVHKNIRPEIILIFATNSSSVGPSFLSGFEKFRKLERTTYLTGDLQWERNLYRHPQRQGLNPEEQYKMQHDIYSLGVCLLEIGLWESFVRPSEHGGIAIPWEGLNITTELSLKDSRKIAYGIKRKLVSTALDRLPYLMGQKYTDITVSCLTCLDRGNEDFGSEDGVEDGVGIEIGVRYIEKVLLEIQEISV